MVDPGAYSTIGQGVAFYHYSLNKSLFERNTSTFIENNPQMGESKLHCVSAIYANYTTEHCIMTFNYADMFVQYSNISHTIVNCSK